MKLLADECCSAGLVSALRADGHAVLYVLEAFPGATDDVILDRAFSQDRLLLTEDKDFDELVHRLGLRARGIILLRFDVTDRELKAPRMRELLTRHREQLHGSFVVLEVDKVRIRPLYGPER
jgi:predicted nuclease of predicted toxin-antitoxin system